MNVNGLNQSKKRRELFRYIRGKSADLVLLQETYSNKAIETLWSNEWGSRIYFSHGASNSRGVACMINKNSSISIEGYWNDTEGRFIALQCVINDKKIMIVNAYGPNDDNSEFFHKIFDFVEKHRHECDEFLIAGDLNVTLDFYKDKKGPFAFDNHVHKRNTLNEYIEELGLIDTWRYLNPDKFRFTWRRMEPHITMSRLDYFLISPGLLPFLQDSQIHSKFITDHGLIALTLNLNENRRGPGYWKFNSLHLQDEDFTELINSSVDEYVMDVNNSNTDHPPDVFWEGLKAKLIAVAMEFSIKKAKSRNNLINVLQLKLEKLDQKLANGDPNVDKIKKDIHKTEQFMLDEHENITMGAMFRSKTQFYEQGGKPSKYFFNLEKSQSRAKTINRLQRNDGIITTDSKDILKELHFYYQNLYQTRPHKSLKECEIPPLPVLDQNLRDLLDTPFTLEEISEALQSMPNNKCPGLDGLTTKFYKKFWPKIKNYYFAALMYDIQQLRLHQTARLGLLSLLPKKDKVGLIIKNWRPLTLMNVDYKIYSKALSLRLKEVLPHLIHQDQSGFMAGRDISFNIRRTLDIIQFANNTQLQALILQIDCEKAFDSLETDIVLEVLDEYGFGKQFIDYVRILFEGAFSCIINNGWKSKYFYPTRSVKQGCSTSPFLFILSLELLSNAIRNNKAIKGINIDDVEHKISQFADDITLYLMFDRTTLIEVVKELDRFYDFSGIQVNYDKTTVYRIGSIKDSNAKLYTNKPFLWTNNPITVLGFRITNDYDEMQRINLIDAFVKAQEICNRWKRRNLTLSACIIIVNNLIASLFVYKITCLDNISEMYLKEYENLVKNFLWEGRPKFKLETLYNSKDYGGLALVNLSNKIIAVRAQWVSKYKHNASVQCLAKHFISDENVWTYNLTYKDFRAMFNVQSEFWNNVFEAWCCISHRSPKDNLSRQCIAKMPVSFNSHIKVAGRVLRAPPHQDFSRIQDYMKSTGQKYRYFTQDEIFQKVQDWNVTLRIMGVRAAIPAAWSAILKGESEFTGVPPLKFEYNNIPRKITSMVYKQLTYCEGQHQNLSIKWNNKLKINSTKEEFDDAFCNIKRIVSDNKLRDFQFRFLHRKIFTNYILKKWKITDTDRCTFCEIEYETIEHLFFICPISKRFWVQLTCWYEAMTDSEINLEYKQILLNQYFERKTTILDTIILMAKQYIFRCRTLQKELNFFNFKTEMFQVCRIERRIAIKNHKEKKFRKKWGLFLKE